MSVMEGKMQERYDALEYEQMQAEIKRLRAALKDIQTEARDCEGFNETADNIWDIARGALGNDDPTATRSYSEWGRKLPK